MASTVGQSPDSRHRLLAETRPRMVKADLRKTEKDVWRMRIGLVVKDLADVAGSLKEFADDVKRDERQCARWITGDEHPQFAAIMAVEKYRQPLVVALAELAGDGVEVITEIRVRRRRIT